MQMNKTFFLNILLHWYNIGQVDRYNKIYWILHTLWNIKHMQLMDISGVSKKYGGAN